MGLETENLQIRENLTQVNEDRADVIAYLKRLLKTKTQDIIELEEQVTTLQQVGNASCTEPSSSHLMHKLVLSKLPTPHRLIDY